MSVVEGLPWLADDLVRVETALRSSVQTGDPFLTDVASHLIGAGGKRIRPALALCAGYAAGLAVAFWENPDDLRVNWQEDKRWTPAWSEDQRASGYAGWQKAVQRTLDWVDVE